MGGSSYDVPSEAILIHGPFGTLKNTLRDTVQYCGSRCSQALTLDSAESQNSGLLCSQQIIAGRLDQARITKTVRAAEEDLQNLLYLAGKESYGDHK